MNATSKDVIEINLRDLVFDLLYRWRSLIAAILIGAILLGGYAWISNRKSQKQAAETTVVLTEQEKEAAKQAEEERLVEVNRIPKKMLEKYTQLLDANVQYMDNSILMNTDPYQEWQARAVYAVSVNGADQESTAVGQDASIVIAAAYPSAVYFDWDQAKLREIYGENGAAYASELFRCSTVEQSGTFMVSAIGLTEDMAKAGLEYLKDTILAFSSGNGQSLGTHQLVLLNEYTIQVIDLKAEEQLRNMYALRAAYQTGVTNSNNAIQKPAVPSTAITVPTKSVVTQAIIGGLIGFLVLLFIYFVRYVLCGKLQRSQMLQQQGFAIYGQFNHSRARRPGKGLDKLIENLEFRKNRVARETVIENICTLLKEKASGEVLLTSTLPLTDIQTLCAEIHKRVKGDLSIRVEEDFLNNRAVIEAANRVQSIVLMEEKYISNVKDIRRMADVLAICETPVIGAVVL